MKNKRENPDYYYFPKDLDSNKNFIVHNSNSGLIQNSNRHRLLYSYPNMPDLYEKQILLDLQRTFSDTPDF